MAMFDGPEYASYIALCRELRLERKLQEGDWYGWTAAGFFIHVELYGSAHRDPEKAERKAEGHESWWLPRLDQWLAMLEEVGLPDVFILPRWAVGEFSIGAYLQTQSTVSGRAGEGPTREEAAARLWKAVVDEIAQREGVTSY